MAWRSLPIELAVAAHAAGQVDDVGGLKYAAGLDRGNRVIVVHHAEACLDFELLHRRSLPHHELGERETGRLARGGQERAEWIERIGIFRRNRASDFPGCRGTARWPEGPWNYRRGRWKDAD